MRAEASAALAEIAARLGHRPTRHTEGLCFGGRVDHPHHLPVLEALVGRRFSDDRKEVPPRLGLGRSGVVMTVFHADGSGSARA